MLRAFDAKGVPPALLLAFIPAVGLGLARFGYALIVPDMTADLGWSYTDAGWPNTANAAGYLTGALVAGMAGRAVESRAHLSVAVLALVLLLAVQAAVTDLALMAALRFAAGVLTATAFIGGASVVGGSGGGGEREAALRLGVYCGGPGLGILLSALTVPPLGLALGPQGWPWLWLTLAGLAVPLALASAFGIRHAARSAPPPAPTYGRKAPGLATMAPLLAGYLLFGAGYIGYMTFMFTWIRQSGAGVGGLVLFWSVLGLCTVLSPFLWAGMIGRSRGGRAVGVLIAVTLIGAALPLVSAATPVVLLSAVAFGGAFFAVVTAVAHFIRRNLPPERRASAFGYATLAFGAGQTLGPLAVGWISDRAGAGLAEGLTAAALALVLAAACAALQRDIRPPA